LLKDRNLALRAEVSPSFVDFTVSFEESFDAFDVAFEGISSRISSDSEMTFWEIGIDLPSGCARLEVLFFCEAGAPALLRDFSFFSARLEVDSLEETLFLCPI
jgi:hypothetical protein